MLLVTSLFAALLALNNVSTRYVYSLAKDKVFPHQLGKAHPRFHSPHRSALATSATMFVLTASMVLCGLTAVEIYSWFAGVAAFALLIELSLTAISIVVYFRRHPEHPVSFFRSAVAPGIAAVALITGVVLGWINLASLIGGSQTLANIFLVITWGVLFSGCATAVVLRKRRPDTYARIGRQTVAEETVAARIVP